MKNVRLFVFLFLCGIANMLFAQNPSTVMGDKIILDCERVNAIAIEWLDGILCIDFEFADKWKNLETESVILVYYDDGIEPDLLIPAPIPIIESVETSSDHIELISAPCIGVPYGSTGENFDKKMQYPIKGFIFIPDANSEEITRLPIPLTKNEQSKMMAEVKKIMNSF